MTLLEKFRKKFKLTQEQTASLFGVHVSSVIRWEQGHGEPSPYVARNVAFIMEAPIDGVVIEKVHKRLITYGPSATLPWLITQCYLADHPAKKAKPAPVDKQMEAFKS